MTSRITSLLFILAASFSSAVSAHAPDQSYTFLTIDDEKVEGRFELTTKDLNLALNLGLAEKTPPTMEEILAHRQVISDYLLDKVSLSVDGANNEINITSLDQLNAGFAKFVLVYFDLSALNAPAKEIAISNNLFFDHDDKHRSLLIIENNWKTGTIQNEAYISLNFSPNSRQQTLQVDSGSSLRGLWGFIEQGMHHIWIGTDHILFLIALLLPSVMVREGGRWVATPDFRSAFIRVVKIVTVFTVAHSITLSAAALDVMSLNSRLVESIIAISIAAAALHVLWPVFSAHAFWVVLLFGLFHGFGFASVMSELWIPEKYLVWSLLGFNIGVELGQLAIVVLVVPVLFMLRKTAFYQRIVMTLGAAALIAISFYWFAERALDVDFAVGDKLRALVASSDG